MSDQLSTEQINIFQEDGYLIVPGLFDAEEAEILQAAATVSYTHLTLPTILLV